MEEKDKVLYPATRFIPDKDEKGVILVDSRSGDWVSGVLDVVIFEGGKSGSARRIAHHREAMTFTKYRAVREDIDSLDVNGLLDYFKLETEDKKVAREQEEAKATADAEAEAKAQAEREAAEAKAKEAEEAKLAAEKAAAEKKAADEKSKSDESKS